MKNGVFVTIGVLGLVAAASGGSTRGAQTRTGSAAALVEQVRHADYAGDRAALRRLHDQLSAWETERAIAPRVAYWRGFALWRRAFNGFNDSTDPKDLARDLSEAIKDFDRALALDPRFVDAQVGAISCLGNLFFLRGMSPEAIQKYVRLAGPRVRVVKEVDPENPRFLWVMGANQWYTPAERGGGQAAAIAMYEKGLAEARRRAPSADLLEPSWGEPELLMNLAWASLNKSEPDPDGAGRFADAALAIVPYWHYVRDILKPQIRQAKEKSEGAPMPGKTATHALEELGFVVGSWTGTVEGPATAERNPETASSSRARSASHSG